MANFAYSPALGRKLKNHNSYKAMASFCRTVDGAKHILSGNISPEVREAYTKRLEILEMRNK